MWYINEESMELVVHFVEQYESLEDDIIDFVERYTTVEIESYMSHKYWFKCRNEFELVVLTDIIVDKRERLA